MSLFSRAEKYRHPLVIGLYTLLTILLTWPVAARLTGHIPGEATWAFDESTFIWNMWWLKFSLLHLGQTPLETTYTFFPLGVRLTTYTFNLFQAAFGLPLQLAFSLPVANNLTLLFSYVSSAYGAFLLVLYLLRESSRRTYLAAFAAGAVFAFSASRMMYLALGHYNFVTIQWFPFYTLFLIKALQNPSRQIILAAALSAAFCLYAELTYSVFLIFMTVMILIGYRRSLWSSVRRVGLIGLLSLLLTGPFILAVLPDFLDPAYHRPGWGEGLKLSADLVGLVTLTPLHPLSGLEWVAELRAVIEGTARFTDANTLFVGYGILAVALLGWLARRKEARIWLWSAVLFALLSLGPLLTINGQNRFNLDGLEVTFPLPFALLHYLPLINANRVPNRFGILLTLALAVLVGYGLAWLLNRLRPMPLYLLLLGLLLFDQYSVPLPMTEARIPPLYYQIGAEPGDFSLMQLPLGWRNSYGTLGAERTQLQYYQAAHRRPMLGGNTSRNPAFKFDYYAQIPLFKTITEAEMHRNVDETTRQRARQQAPELMTLYNIRYLVVHEPILHRKPYEDTYMATRKLTLDLIPHRPEPVYQSPGVEAFAVEQAPLPDPLTLDFGHWRSDPYRGAGWTGNEEIFAATANWAAASQATLFFPVRGSGDRFAALQIAPFSYPGMPAQRVELALNEHLLADSFSLREGWQTIEITLPERYLQPGLNRLELRFAHTAQPRQVLPANRTIGQTGLTTPVDLELNSGVDFAFITVGFDDEAEDASSHRRGVNLAVVDPLSGEVVARHGFDTAANRFEAAALARFIAEIPPGRIVAAATKGEEATAFFQAETWAALQTIGLAAEPLEPPFSLIGVKGAEPGAALWSEGYLRLGTPPDTRALAAAVDRVVIGSRSGTADTPPRPASPDQD